MDENSKNYSNERRHQVENDFDLSIEDRESDRDRMGRLDLYFFSTSVMEHGLWTSSCHSNFCVHSKFPPPHRKFLVKKEAYFDQICSL